MNLKEPSDMPSKNPKKVEYSLIERSWPRIKKYAQEWEAHIRLEEMLEDYHRKNPEV